ncbi:hypothetical protein BGZ76_006400, partial [Entomortierella beljakovae]
SPKHNNKNGKQSRSQNILPRGLHNIQNQTVLQFEGQQYLDGPRQTENLYLQQTPQRPPPGYSFTPVPVHSSPQALRKRPHIEGYEPSGENFTILVHDNSSASQQGIENPVYYQSINQHSPAAIARYHPSYSTMRNIPHHILPIQPQLSSAAPVSPFLYPNPSYSNTTPNLQRVSSSSQPVLELQTQEKPSEHANNNRDASESFAKPSSKKKNRPTNDEIQARIRKAQAAFGGTKEWCQFYKTTPMGSIPSPAQLADHPPPDSLKKLLGVPIEKATRNDSELGHFYSKAAAKVNISRGNDESSSFSGDSHSDNDNAASSNR